MWDNSYYYRKHPELSWAHIETLTWITLATFGLVSSLLILVNTMSVDSDSDKTHNYILLSSVSGNIAIGKTIGKLVEWIVVGPRQ